MKNLSDDLPTAMTQHFNAIPSGPWTYQFLSTRLEQNREPWQIPAELTADECIELLLQRTPLVRTTLAFPGRPLNSFWWGAPSPYQAAMGIDPRGFLTHQTAAYLHGLLQSEPDVIYVNVEQANTGKNGGRLTQNGIDRAFNGLPRISNARAEYLGKTICKLSGKNTANLGALQLEHEAHGLLRCSNIERTLIDVVVRPVYSGGVTEVLAAYTAACGKVSGSAILATLRQLDYSYPYHQTIGFYLERAGYDGATLDIFQELGADVDFYLDYQMAEPLYSKRWRLHYPRELG